MMDTKFFVNKDKRTIVCIITTINDVPERLEKYGLADDEYYDVDEVCTYTGYAHC